MGRLIRNTAILAKIETIVGTDANPAGATDALMVQNASFEWIYNNQERQPQLAYMGGKQVLPGTRFVKASFEVELAGSGTAGTAPAWGKLLMACAFAEVTSASAVEYTPVSTGLKSLTIKYILDGIVHTMVGCMGDVELDLQEGAIPKMTFNFTGRDAGNSAAAMPSVNLASWKVPMVVTADNSGSLTLGGTYTTAAVTGGTAYPARGLNIKMGNAVQQIPLLGGNSIDITDRNATGSTQLELTAAQEIQMISDVNAAASTSVSMLHGTTAGAKVMVFAPSVLRTNPKHVDYQGRAHMAFDLNFIPLAGNDEVRIVAL